MSKRIYLDQDELDAIVELLDRAMGQQSSQSTDLANLAKVTYARIMKKFGVDVNEAESNTEEPKNPRMQGKRKVTCTQPGCEVYTFGTVLSWNCPDHEGASIGFTPPNTKEESSLTKEADHESIL